MREVVKKQLKILTNSDSTTLQKEVNKFFCKHIQAQHIKTEYAVDNGNYIAFIEYGEKTLAPDNAKDEYTLRGEEYRCGSCPYFGANYGSSDPFSCHKKQREGATVSTTKCCDLFYELLKEGVIDTV